MYVSRCITISDVSDGGESDRIIDFNKVNGTICYF